MEELWRGGANLVGVLGVWFRWAVSNEVCAWRRMYRSEKYSEMDQVNRGKFFGRTW